MPRQHKRLQRAKFLSAVGKEETGAVVYREVGRLSPCSPFSPPCQHCMTATSWLGLHLDLPHFFHSGLCSAPLGRPCHRPWGGCWEAGRGGPNPAAEPRWDATTLLAPAGQPQKPYKSRRGGITAEAESKACTAPAAAFPGTPGIRRGAGMVHIPVPTLHPVAG